MQPGPGQTPAERTTELLDSDRYRTTSRFDALNRPVVQVLPTDVEGRRRELRPRYNRAGGLEQVRLDDALYVERIAYDASGQRALVAYANGVMTRYSHDRDTFRLTRMRSERYTGGGLAYAPIGEPIQDYGYDYDLAGNIMAIRDRTPESGIPNNPEALTTTDPALGRLLIGGDALNRRFTYDPTYRLGTATGRECDIPPSALPSSRTTNREFSSPGATAHCPVEFPAVRHSACPAVCAALAVRCLISHISHYRNIR